MDEINALSSFDGVKMPFSLEAEQAVLGSLLIDPGCMPQVLMLVKGEYFYLPQHQAIFGHHGQYRRHGWQDRSAARVGSAEKR